MGVLSTPFAPQMIEFLFDMAFENTSPQNPKWETHYERMYILNRDAISVILEVLPSATSQELHLEVARKLNVLAAGSRQNSEALSKLGRLIQSIRTILINRNSAIPHIILTRFRDILCENHDEKDLIELSSEESKSKTARKELQGHLLHLLQVVGTNSYVLLY